MKKYYYILFIFIAFGCKPKLDENIELFNNGTADLSNVIYIGDNLLSGFQDGGLYLGGQENSLASILSTQFKQVGGNEISQPLMEDGSGSTHLIIDTYTSENFTTIWNTENSSITGTNDIQLNICNNDSVINQFAYYSDAINNYATPEMKVSDIKSNSIGTINEIFYNPYFERISGSNSYFDLIDNSTPSFFISAFGLSDVLANAKEGWACNSSTSETLFKSNYTGIIKLLVDKGAKGALVEVPNIENLPFLNVEYLATETIYIQAKQGFNDAIEIRELDTVNDIILREYVSIITVDGYGTTIDNPILDKHIIDSFEKDQISSDIDKYNLVIRKLASQYNLALVDMENYLLSESGIQDDKILLNGINTTIKYEIGSGISLDGIFPTARGAAAIANKCIDAINVEYEALIPLVDINKYPGLQLP